jgi:hypothetical protein
MIKIIIKENLLKEFQIHLTKYKKLIYLGLYKTILFYLCIS